MSYVALQAAFDWVFPKGNLYYWKTVTLDRLNDEAIATVVAWADSSPRLERCWAYGSREARSADGRQRPQRMDRAMNRFW